MGEFLSDIKSKNTAGASPPIAGIFVVYDLPDRDCAALASNGEYSIADGGVEKYKAYIDSIRETLVEYSDVHTILIIGKSIFVSDATVPANSTGPVEPDSLANLVTNMAVSKCANAYSAYLECVNYAVTELNLNNVAMYLDAGKCLTVIAFRDGK